MTTLEGNKLIGDFMGKSFKDPLNYMYDNSWDWLMPVVEKINKTCSTQLNNYDFNRGEDAQHNFVILLPEGKYWNDCPYGGKPDRIWNKPQLNSMIRAVYETVTQFIQWHNKQNTPA